MGLTIMRWIARKNESNLFPSIPNNWGFNGQYKPSQTHPVHFERLEYVRPLHITPYLLGGFSSEHLLTESADGVNSYIRDDQFTYEAGVDVKYGISSNLTLDLTINTDFAQVEADDEQVNLTRFALFLPEKRRFFQERSDLFDINMGGSNRLFYSRRVGIRDGEQIRILGGARMTGSIGSWDIGLMKDRDHAFTTHIARVRVEFFLNTQFSVRSFFQYSNASHQVLSNLRLRYNPREGNDFYILFNENLNTNRFATMPVQPVSQFRTVLLKYNYTF